MKKKIQITTQTYDREHRMSYVDNLLPLNSCAIPFAQILSIDTRCAKNVPRCGFNELYTANSSGTVGLTGVGAFDRLANKLNAS